jgi:D-beta-D-heptose 7-phosphate kinase/D-beta-D-heptose 1-phosphate adenosyltransferase
MTEQQSRLAAAVSSLTRAQVLCVGDIMLDRFVYGVVDRISPEAPIPVVRVTRETAMLGGSGNVVRNLVGLGAAVQFLSLVGDDAAGREVADMLGRLPRVEPMLEVEPDRQTSIKTRFIAGVQQLLRADQETVKPLDDTRAESLLTTAQSIFNGDHGCCCGALVLSDYGKGVLTPEVTRRLIEMAQAAGVPVVVDPKGRDYRRYRGATLVTPNRKELTEASDLPTASDSDVVAAATAVIESCGIHGVLATRSQDGMTLITDAPGATVCHLPAEAREVFDVSGAGDTVIATVAAALAAGLSLYDGAYLSNVAAGLVVGKVGTAAVQADELIHALHRQGLDEADAKVLTLDQMADQVDRWRLQGLKVGFTNGCFDLLHPGHLSLLRQARAACDRLIVGLNSDASVRALKGDSRPVQSETARAAVLSSLSMVDGVVIFSDDTPLALIERLLPDVLVKGADYTVETVVGAPIVLAHGGQVVLATLEPGQSTTNTIRRLTGDGAG